MTSNKQVFTRVRRISIFALLLAIIIVSTNYGLTGRVEEVSAKVEKVQVQVGKPNVWSLSQAHYLLSKLRKTDKELGINTPSRDALDPNRANTARLQALRSFLGISAEFSQKVGVENKTSLDEQKDILRNRDSARKQLPSKQRELEGLNKKLFELKTTQAELQTEEDFRQKEIAAEQAKSADKQDPKILEITEADKTRKKRLERLKVKIGEFEEQKELLETEISELKAQANPEIGTTLQEVDPAIADQDRLKGLDLSGLIEKVTKDGKFEAPNLAASAVLDNFISMQYEIMAKQLTLLRDEAGPDEEIVFLELPCSLYAVPGEADNYMAQVKWKVERYFAGRPDNSIDKDKDKDKDKRSQPSTFDFENLEKEWKANKTTDLKGLKYKQCNNKTEVAGFMNATGSSLRTVEIIPRQSALNISEYQATTSQFNFLGIAKFLSGIGLKVSYQRQKELYEQFLKQEIYASGFGKGNLEFGWTFGAMPGSKSIAPGARTTYAVMAVPKGTSVLEVSVQGIAFHNKKKPSFTKMNDKGEMAQDATVLTEEKFLVKIPNQYTENFYVDSIDYVPAKKGHKTTVRIQGKSFSPQIGVLVNGVPLKWSMSMASNETVEEASLSVPQEGIYGEFEYLNQGEIALNFAMPKTYVGTPTITLVTPTRASAINYYRLDVNGDDNASLQSKSIFEPMFMDDFSSQLKVDPVFEEIYSSDSKASKEKKVEKKIKKLKIIGNGFRPDARIWVNDKNEEDGKFKFHHLTTTLYEIKFDELMEDKEITGRFFQKTKQGFEEASFVYEPEKATPAISHTVVRYIPNDAGLAALVDLQLKTTDSVIKVVLPAIYGKVVNFENEGNKTYRVQVEVKPNQVGKKFIERDVVVITLEQPNGNNPQAISLPIYPYISTIVNTETGEAKGNFAQEEKVVIRGRNLQNASLVLFGSAKGEILSRNYDYILVKVPALLAQEKLSLSVTLESLSGDSTKVFSNSLNYTYKKDKEDDVTKTDKKNNKDKNQIKITQKNLAIFDLPELDEN